MKKLFYLAFLMFFVLPNMSLAHSGRTDSSGCHTCRTNCSSWGLSTGEYHCHRAKSTVPQPIEPVKSHKVEGGVGYTTSAPEYKSPVVNGVSEKEIKVEEKKIEEKVSVKKSSNNLSVKKVDNNQQEDNDGSGWFWALLLGGGAVLFVKSKVGKKK